MQGSLQLHGASQPIPGAPTVACKVCASSGSSSQQAVRCLESISVM